MTRISRVAPPGIATSKLEAGRCNEARKRNRTTSQNQGPNMKIQKFEAASARKGPPLHHRAPAVPLQGTESGGTVFQLLPEVTHARNTAGPGSRHARTM